MKLNDLLIKGASHVPSEAPRTAQEARSARRRTIASAETTRRTQDAAGAVR